MSVHSIAETRKLCYHSVAGHVDIPSAQLAEARVLEKEQKVELEDLEMRQGRGPPVTIAGDSGSVRSSIDCPTYRSTLGTEVLVDSYEERKYGDAQSPEMRVKLASETLA